MAKKKEPKLIKLSDTKEVDISKLGFPDIIDYCKANKQVKWLKEINAKTETYTDKKTGEEKTRRVSFLVIRNEFLRKFFPETAPKPVEKKANYRDLIDALEEE